MTTITAGWIFRILKKISNVIWTKCRLKCNLETRIFKHVYHIKITLQDHTRLQKAHIMWITQIIQNYANACEQCETTQKYTKPLATTVYNHPKNYWCWCFHVNLLDLSKIMFKKQSLVSKGFKFLVHQYQYGFIQCCFKW